MTALCPVCGLPGGFHDEDTHAAIIIPAHLIRHDPPPPEGCPNCGAPFTAPAIPPCRNPHHAYP